MKTIRKTTLRDLDRVLEIYDRARRFMAENGNPDQWGTTGWPPEALIRRDISEGRSYVCENEAGKVAGTFFFTQGPDAEPTYREITGGEWLDGSPYGVVHRIASDGSEKGIGAFCLDWAYRQCGHLRIDTHGDNTVMQGLLRKLGFIHCGTIFVEEDDAPRMAFEKSEKTERARCLSFLVSGYARAGEPGILAAELDPRKGELTVSPACSELENPSWILMHPGGEVLYAAEELAPAGRIAVLKREGAGWKTAGRIRAGGAPCHLALDGSACFLLASNYADGSLQVWRLDSSGMPGERTAEVRRSGRGADPARQEGPHVHSSLVCGDTVYAADLGLDRIFVYRLDRADGSLTPEKEFVFPAGSGPRHMAVHGKFPGYLYADTEMGGKVYVIRTADGKAVQERKVIPDDFREPFRVSSVRFAEDTLYVGSRECNMVTLFSLGEDGMLGEPARYRHRGETPRDVWMNGDWCLTADEGSGGLTLLRREGLRLTQAGAVPTPGLRPTCILPMRETSAAKA